MWELYAKRGGGAGFAGVKVDRRVSKSRLRGPSRPTLAAKSKGAMPRPKGFPGSPMGPRQDKKCAKKALVDGEGDGGYVVLPLEG